VTVCVSRNDEATGAIDTDLMFRQCQPHRNYSSPAELDVATNTYATRKAINWVIAHPQQELRMWFWRTYLAFSDDSSGIGDKRETMDPRWADVLASASDAASYAVLAFGAIGLVVVARKRNRGGLFVTATAMALASVPIILYGDPRYRVPAEPFFAILAAAGLVAALTGATTTAPRAAPSIRESG
jgi:hypothetical protein